MFCGVELNEMNIKQCRERAGPWAIVGYIRNQLQVDQIPLPFIARHFARHPAIFVKYPDDPIVEEVVVKKELKRKQGIYDFILW